MTARGYLNLISGTALLILVLIEYGFQAIPDEIRIVDTQTGQSLAASVRVLNADDEIVEVAGNHDHVEYLSRRWCYVDGAFRPEGNYDRLRLEARRGPETFPVEREIEVGRGTVTVPLSRWIDMKQESFVSGDGHAHLLTLEQAHLQMRAEDLNAVSLQTSDFTGDTHLFTGKLAEISTPHNSIFVGQEFRDWQMGHTNFLRIKHIVEPLSPFGGRHGSRSERNLLLAPAMREARSQGGAVTWAHFSNLPGHECPIDIALGLVDAIELVTYDDPTELPSHWAPWIQSGFDTAEFPPLRGVDLYYQYLNAGIQLPITAGTDKMGEDIPLGSNRLYVPFRQNPTYDEWLNGMKEGTGFVTNSPIVTFQVGPHRSGDKINFRDSESLDISATSRSLLRFSRLEIIANGKTIAQNSSPVRLEDGVYHADIEVPIEITESTWLAARVTRLEGQKQRVLPRGLTVFAHTNPVYLLRDGRPVHRPASVAYLQRWVEGTIHWLKTGADFSTAATRQEALELAEEALDFYRNLQRDSARVSHGGSD